LLGVRAILIDLGHLPLASIADVLPFVVVLGAYVAPILAVS
jgi:hypothetical protein